MCTADLTKYLYVYWRIDFQLLFVLDGPVVKTDQFRKPYIEVIEATMTVDIRTAIKMNVHTGRKLSYYQYDDNDEWHHSINDRMPQRWRWRSRLWWDGQVIAMAMVVAGGGVDVSWYGYSDSDDGDDEQFNYLFTFSSYQKGSPLRFKSVLIHS